MNMLIELNRRYLQQKMSRFTNDDIPKLFTDMTPETRQILTVDLKPLLIPTIQALKTIGLTVPRSDQIFNAFKLCPVENTSVVIIGQDPYHDGSAMGLSFSALRGGKIPPSLRNIYSALCAQGLIQAMPKHPDLSRWASQGVLLLNTALTTAPKKAGAHTDVWREYVGGIIQALVKRPTPIAFVLWGVHAKNIMSGVDTSKHTIIEWGHPSPMTDVNRRVNDPDGFINCDSFVRVNKFLESVGRPPIDWNVDEGAAIPLQDAPTHGVIPSAPILGSPLVLKPPSTLWVFTDGGAVGNGRADCRATWAWYATDGASSWVSRGHVESVVIGGQKIPPSNNRGELTALMSAIHWVSTECQRYGYVMIVSDSEYSLNCIRDWYSKWKAKGILAEKKNIDLIATAHAAYTTIKTKTTMMWTGGHGVEPEDKNSAEWFVWKGNDICDKLCEQ